LHELLAADPRHTYANTFVSFSPNHFLLTGRVYPRLFGMLLPPMRPMDNMPVKWECPQEDEWAMCNMGVPSPYLTVVFPNRPPQCPEYLDLRDVPPAALAKWKATFLRFLRCLTAQNPKRIVLKSPQHTCRVRTLLEMFPKARFVHIVRDPYFIFPSTMKTWKRMYKYHGLQVPRFEGLEEFVFHVFERMYGVFEEDRSLIPPGQLCEVRYEDLVREPMRQMQRIYESLNLGEFEPARPAVEAYVARTAGYRPSRYELDPALCEEIGRRWAAYCERYGYTAPVAATAAPTGASEAQSGAA
jgi:omega-hydroxy-beta-dihydromenaquinone-9 sulfotransferase